MDNSKTIEDCFAEYSYHALISERQFIEQKSNLDAFYSEINDNEKIIYPELQQIYISKHTDEMFLIINPSCSNLNTLQKLCDEWDRKIMSFINFGILFGGTEEKNMIPQLRYNIFQIILCSNISDVRDNFSIEKSVKVSRKILLPYKNNLVTETDQILLPFYDTVLNISPQLQSDNSKLDYLRPPEALNLTIKRERTDSHNKKFFNEDEFSSIERWIMEHGE